MSLKLNAKDFVPSAAGKRSFAIADSVTGRMEGAYVRTFECLALSTGFGCGDLLLCFLCVAPSVCVLQLCPRFQYSIALLSPPFPFSPS